ncbi:hypothetical protein MC885_018049 [Smutsia gigantea]|nr:hypothetical protein MC885_018049 [Smutsia gigantea]
MAAARVRVLGARWLQRTARNVVPLGARTASHITKDMLPGPYPRTPEERSAAAKKYNMRVEDYEPYPDDGMGITLSIVMHWDIDMYIRNRVDTSPTPVSWNVMCKHLFGFVAFMVFMFWVGETYPTYQPVAEGHVSFLPPIGQTMELKELEWSAVQVWSPASQYPVYLGTGTTDHQLDASFSTSGTLEIFEVDFRDPSLDLKCKGVLSASSSLFFMQGNLLASGASDSEIFIWDLNNLSVPMTPGSKSQRHCSGLAWHPDIATQLVLCSEDDRLLVIQLWDLHFASLPLMVLENHSRGILSVSRSQADAELLLSCAKDHRILCWNLGSSEVVYKLPTQSSWCSDVQWCLQDPSVFSAASFDGWIGLYSVKGRSWEVQQRRQAGKPSAASPTIAGARASDPGIINTSPEKTPQMDKKASRCFICCTGRMVVPRQSGGKLVTFGLSSTPAHQVPQPHLHLVFVSQVTTESEFLMWSAELQEALGSGNLPSYCQSKIQQASLQSEKMLWQFLKVTLEQDSRMKFLKLLGYSKDEFQKKVTMWLKNDLGSSESPQPLKDDLSSSRLQVSCSQTCFHGSLQTPHSLGTTVRHRVHKASKYTTEEASASSTFYDELIPQNMTPWKIPITEDTDGLLSQAFLLGELGPAVELSLKEERFAAAIILAQAGGADSLKQTQEGYLAKKKTKISLLLACVVQKNWKDMVCACSLKNWREALALLLTYSGLEKFPGLCAERWPEASGWNMLATRMEQEGSRALTSEARLCYGSSGSVEQLVERWGKCHQAPPPMALQIPLLYRALDLMEKVMVLNRSLELLQCPNGPLIQQLRDQLFHVQSSGVLGQ